MTVSAIQLTYTASHASESVRTQHLCDEGGWDVPKDFESALEDLVLTGHATRHVCDNGRVLYEFEWPCPPTFVTYTEHSH